MRRILELSRRHRSVAAVVTGHMAAGCSQPGKRARSINSLCSEPASDKFCFTSFCFYKAFQIAFLTLESRSRIGDAGGGGRRHRYDNPTRAANSRIDALQSGRIRESATPRGEQRTRRRSDFPPHSVWATPSLVIAHSRAVFTVTPASHNPHLLPPVPRPPARPAWS